MTVLVPRLVRFAGSLVRRIDKIDDVVVGVRGRINEQALPCCVSPSSNPTKTLFVVKLPTYTVLQAWTSAVIFSIVWRDHVVTLSLVLVI